VLNLIYELRLAETPNIVSHRRNAVRPDTAGIE
jgi:hypothetical protein